MAQEAKNAPSWDDAPDWANWRARDQDGEWYWYEFRPDAGPLGGYDTVWRACGGRAQPAEFDEDHWRDTLERRP